jgi:hypothetical protein
VSHSINLDPLPRRGAFLCRAARHATGRPSAWSSPSSPRAPVALARTRRPDRLCPHLQAWPRRHCLEAQGFCLPFGRSPDWLKMKNADAPAVKREAEEDWAR